MDDQTEKGSWNGFSGKSELEQTLYTGIQGVPEIKGEEKSYYLGEFRERVLRALTKSQVGESVLYTEIEAALKDPRAALMVVHGDIDEHALSKYRKLAATTGKPVTSRGDASFNGETGLIVVARAAVEVENIQVEDRKGRLLKKGLTEQLIDAAGESVCKDCFAKLRELAPEELKYYRMQNPLSRLLGEKCNGHE